MPAPPWFRFYSETLTDRKIDRVCRATSTCKALVIGTWTTILALASDSPIRGVLLLTEDIPFTVQDLAGELGIEVDLTVLIVGEFHRFAMMDYDETGTMYVTNWNGRQFASDHSTERVQRFRAKKRALQDEQGNGDETLQGCSGNAPEQSRAETEQSRAEQRQSRAEGNVPAVADVLQEVHDLGVTEPKAGQLVTDYREQGDLPELVPRLGANIEHNKGLPGVDNPMGLAITQTEARQDPPRAVSEKDRRRRYLEGPHADIIIS